MDMRYEKNRLSTFINWPNDAPIEFTRIAKGGFFSTGIGQEVQCFWCSKKISDWQYGDQVMGRHRRLDPLCPFVLNPTTSGNVQITSTPCQTDTQGLPAPFNNGSITTVSSSTTPTANGEQVISLISQQKEATPPNPDFKNEQYRLSTYKNWPKTFITPQSLAKAGFFYYGESDRVRCAYCQGVVGEWEVGDNPFLEHQRLFKNCPRAQLGPNIEITNNVISNLGIQQIGTPKMVKYSLLDARIRTFDRWPRDEQQNPEILAQAGFYYQGLGDQVRCFHCDGGLRYWLPDDDPWFEHARWFPKCPFVLFVKGQQYVNEVQSHVKNTIRESQQQTITLDEAMSSDIVQTALQIGLQEGRVRAVIKRQLEATGKTFTRIEPLFEAVLERQLFEPVFNYNANEYYEIPEESETRHHNCGRNTLIAAHQQDELPHRRPINYTNPSQSSNYNDRENKVHERMRGTLTIELPKSNVLQTSGVTNPSNDLLATAAETSTATNTLQSVSPAKTTASLSCSSSSLSSSTASLVSPATTIASAPTKKLINEKTEELALEEENRKLRDARLCKICMDGEVGVVFLPCGHLVTCVQCAPVVAVCPLCRSEIKGFVRTFLS